MLKQPKNPEQINGQSGRARTAALVLTSLLAGCGPDTLPAPTPSPESSAGPGSPPIPSCAVVSFSQHGTPRDRLARITIYNGTVEGEYYPDKIDIGFGDGSEKKGIDVEPGYTDVGHVYLKSGSFIVEVSVALDGDQSKFPVRDGRIYCESEAVSIPKLS